MGESRWAALRRRLLEATVTDAVTDREAHVDNVFREVLRAKVGFVKRPKLQEELLRDVERHVHN
jgi:hypothetical protein